MNGYQKDAAEQLYALLPAVYRVRDLDRDPTCHEHLRKYLEGCGDLLDLIRHTLEQRYDDSFPDNTVPGRICQDWVLPYFAELLAVRLHSPFPAGQRDEVANAVRWAQRRGTLVAVEEIAEAIAQSEGEIQEGWKRVITTARIDRPLPSAQSVGAPEPAPPDPAAPPGATPQEIARHPAMPAATIDFRRISRAMRTTPGEPASKLTRFGGTGRVWPLDDPDRSPFDPQPDATPQTAWRQTNRQGVPCFIDSYEDVSPRVVDLRTPERGWGLHHPKRLVIYLPPPYGLCVPDPVVFPWDPDLEATEVGGGADAPKLGDYVRLEIDEAGNRTYRNVTAASVRIEGVVTLDQERTTDFEKLRFSDEIVLSAGRLELRRCAVAAVQGLGPLATDEGFGITAIDCLLGTLDAPAHVVGLESVTILGETRALRLLASEAIFVGQIESDAAADCIRFSRVPVAYFAALPPLARENGITTDPPDFYETAFCEPGCGVLRQDAPRSIREGAEDGGEMGAFHAWRYVAGTTALVAKLADYLPLGIEPIVVWDERLLCTPPAVPES